MISSSARIAIAQVLGTWETGSPTGGYDAIAILPDGAGFSGGRHQATVKGGNLVRIVEAYDGIHSAALRAFLPRLPESTAISGQLPEWCVDFIAIWRRAANEDPAFHRAQDAVFDAQYWQPCADQCEAMRLGLPLSWGVCYDICVQSGPGALPGMRKLFAERPPSSGGAEMAWTRALIAARRKWLAGFVSSYAGAKGDNHTKIVRATTYRMDGWKALADRDVWTLTTPFALPLKGRTITIPGARP